ncbi:hypothetical protein G1C94_1393 [Bifidobacterium sp. DSM 109963]|uniref:Uncharacterized protein n=1 Tax=Bifidobacterium panos TaxID=2675321 RepID=A0ABX1T187_9BIFI|nr:hypothetical protein [Bifidobacterium sp. DSM 109963]
MAGPNGGRYQWLVLPAGSVFLSLFLLFALPCGVCFMLASMLGGVLRL